MDFQNHSSPFDLLSQIPLSAQKQQASLHHLPPHILTRTPIPLTDNQIPRKSIKQHPKHLKQVIFSNPNTKSFWDKFGVAKRTSDIQRLKRTSKFLQHTKTLTNLSISIVAVTSFDFKYTLSRLQYLQTASTLELTFNNEQHLTPSNLEMLYHTLASFKHLRRLSIESPLFCESLSTQFLDSIEFALKRLASLTHLSLRFDSYQGFFDSDIDRLALHLCKLSQLRSFVLKLPTSPYISSSGLQRLSETFKNLPLLSDVTIHSLSDEGCSITTICGVFSGLATCKSLKKLDFSILPSPNDERNLGEPISIGLNLLNSSSLREISVNLYPELNDDGFIQLSKALARFASLTSLSIKLSDRPKVSDTSLLQFSSALQTLTLLSTLSLPTIWRGQFSQTIELISQGVGPLTQLRNLSLGFQNSAGHRLTTIQALSSNLKNLKLLKQLDLNFGSCEFLDDTDVALLAKGLGELKNLTNLAIDLKNVKELTNKGLESLLSSFPNFSKLTRFALKLAKNSTNDNILKMMARSFQELPSLNSLDLSFPGVDELSSHEGFAVFCDSLRDLVCLKNITLEVRKTKFAEEKIKALRKIKLQLTWVLHKISKKCSSTRKTEL